MAGEAAGGATAYVTLEPCAHHGRTPPCAEALVRAGIARVVTALEDPDPRVSGGGHAILRAAGILVETGIGAEEVRRDLAGFFTRIVKKRPHVTLKLAVSADDKIAERPGARTAITGPEVQSRVHLMRAESDAILVGMDTVLADDRAHLPLRVWKGARPPFVLAAPRSPAGSSWPPGEVLRGAAAALPVSLARHQPAHGRGGARTARGLRK
jgi:diaminohydroxyphosphoribosylaminopyrimidine deaminase/5-amino-6-(5-phosphoribosylamino)uracil reductase